MLIFKSLKILSKYGRAAKRNFSYVNIFLVLEFLNIIRILLLKIATVHIISVRNEIFIETDFINILFVFTKHCKQTNVPIFF